MLKNPQVFVDGGVQLFRDNGTTWLGFSRYIYQIDLGDSWDTATNYTVTQIGRFGNGFNPPYMVRGALYRNSFKDSKLFTFGGSTFIANTTDPAWTMPSSDEISLWSYDTSSQTWAQYDVSSAVPRRPNRGLVTEAIPLGTGFFVNGQIDRGSDSALYSAVEYVGGVASNSTNDEISYLDGMLIVDMATQTVRNVSTETLGASRVAGGLVWAQRFGKTENGTVVAFGGMRSAGRGDNTFTNGILVDFKNVSLCDSFDEEEVVWVNQTTSGDIPPPRIDFCTLPAPKTAQDNSSNNFYIYGGYDPTTSTLYDDVYVLSVPSFTWTKLYDGTSNFTTPRFGHTCHTAGKRQMMVVGGALDASLYGVETTGQLPNLTTLTCDPWSEGVAIFDLSNLTWGTQFDYYAPPYQVPKAVVDKIGGSGEGGATMTQPVGGFANAAVYTMFHPPPPTATPSTNATAVPDSRQQHSSNTGAIAGGVVGGVVGLAGIACLALWLRRMKSNHRRQAQLQEMTQRQELDPDAALPAYQSPIEKARQMSVGTTGTQPPTLAEAEDTSYKELPANSPSEELLGNLPSHQRFVRYELPAEVPTPPDYNERNRTTAFEGRD